MSVDQGNLLDLARQFVSILPLDRLSNAGIERSRESYFLNISYPSLQAMKSVRPEEIFTNCCRINQEPSPVALYVHIPFCSSLCSYCHYYKLLKPTALRVTEYLTALSQEVALTFQHHGKVKYRSLYVGGGTPSLLTFDQIRQLFETLNTVAEPSNDATEVSFEVHPENASPELFSLLRNLGVNRLNIGVESFDDRILASENRRHSRDDALRAFKIATEAGFTNINIDCIYGLRHQTLESWSDTLDTIAILAPASFCAYYLRLKQGTPEYKRFLHQPEEFASEADLLTMHAMTFLKLYSMGYSQETVDWFIRDRKYFHEYQDHNWQKTDTVPLVGLGVSAYSYQNGWQYYNHNDLAKYIQAVANGVLPIWRGERLDGDERIRRAVMLGIKSKINRKEFSAVYGVDPACVFAEDFARMSELDLVSVSQSTIGLTELGKLFADEVGQAFYSETMKRRMGQLDPSLISTTLPRFNPHD